MVFEHEIRIGSPRSERNQDVEDVLVMDGLRIPLGKDYESMELEDLSSVRELLRDANDRVLDERGDGRPWRSLLLVTIGMGGSMLNPQFQFSLPVEFVFTFGFFFIGLVGLFGVYQNRHYEYVGMRVASELSEVSSVYSRRMAEERSDVSEELGANW